MIELQDITFRYKDSEQENSLQNINLSIPTGEAVLLCGKSGCGKTTITRLLNGLVPHFYEGNLSGKVLINGRNSQSMKLQEWLALFFKIHVPSFLTSTLPAR